MKCDVIAEGVLQAVREMGLNLPLVVRLEGTNVEQGKTLIRQSGLTVISADSLPDGCKKAAEAAARHRDCERNEDCHHGCQEQATLSTSRVKGAQL